MSEIQFCEDCKHRITTGTDFKPRCAASPVLNGDEYVTRFTPNDYFYCCVVRRVAKEACLKFEAKDG